MQAPFAPPLAERLRPGPAHGHQLALARAAREPERLVAAHIAPPTFATIYERWFGQICDWIRSLGAAEAENRDLAQEVLIIVSRRLPHFDGVNPGAWLYRIVQRRVRDHRRTGWIRRVRPVGDVAMMAHVPDPRFGADGELERRQEAETLNRLISALPDDQRVAFVLFEIEGWSGEQIAALQRVALNTVWTRLRRARRRLRDAAEAAHELPADR